MRTRKGYRSGRPVLAFTLIILSVGSYFIERDEGGDWANLNHVLGFALLVWYLRMFFRDQRAVILTSFYQIFYSLGMLFSAVLISGGAHMIEVGQYGTQNGFFWVMMLYFVAGMEMTRAGYSVGGRIYLGIDIWRPPSTINYLAIFVIVGITLAVAVYVFVLTGGPFLRGIDRVTFWQTMAPDGTTFLPSLTNQSFFFAAFYFLWQRRSGGNMFLPTTMVLGYVLTAILVLGQKFSIFILFLNAWLLLLPGILPDFRFKLKNIVALAVAVVAIMMYTVAFYLLDDQEASFVITRASLQAQLLWSVFDDPYAISLLPREASCYFGCGLFDSGMDYITYRYLPGGLYNFYIEKGNRLSGFLPALPILTFGLVAATLLHLTITFILGFVQRKMVISSANENPIYGFLLFKLQFSLVIMWFVGDMQPFLGFVLTLALIVVYRIALATRTGGVKQASRRRRLGAAT